MSQNIYLCIVSSIRIAYCFVRIAIRIVSSFFRIDPALVMITSNELVALQSRRRYGVDLSNGYLYFLSATCYYSVFIDFITITMNWPITGFFNTGYRYRPFVYWVLSNPPPPEYCVPKGERGSSIQVKTCVLTDCHP